MGFSSNLSLPHSGLIQGLKHASRDQAREESSGHSSQFWHPSRVQSEGSCQKTSPNEPVRFKGSPALARARRLGQFMWHVHPIILHGRGRVNSSLL